MDFKEKRQTFLKWNESHPDDCESAVPLFPKPKSLVLLEENTHLLAALLPALDKYKCLESYSESYKRKRSPWVSAFLYLHRQNGPWEKFQHKHKETYKYSFRTKIRTIHKYLRLYEGNSGVHKELLKRLDEYYSKIKPSKKVRRKTRRKRTMFSIVETDSDEEQDIFVENKEEQKNSSILHHSDQIMTESSFSKKNLDEHDYSRETGNSSENKKVAETIFLLSSSGSDSESDYLPDGSDDDYDYSSKKGEPEAQSRRNPTKRKKTPEDGSDEMKRISLPKKDSTKDDSLEENLCSKQTSSKKKTRISKAFEEDQNKFDNCHELFIQKKNNNSCGGNQMMVSTFLNAGYGFC